MSYKLISREEMRHYCKKLNILIGAMEGKGGSKSRIMAQGGLNYGTGGNLLVDELIKTGHLNHIQLRGDHNWVTISDKGTKLIQAWHDFKKKLIE